MACTGEWPAPIEVDLAQLTTDHDEWREWRRSRLVTPPGGAVLWVGLHDLGEGRTAFGSDPTLPIVLSALDSPPHAGTLLRNGSGIVLEPAEGSPLRRDDGSPIVEAIALGNDREGEFVQFAIGSLGMRIHAERGSDRLWLRVWDEDLPNRESFRLPAFYPVDAAWILPARFDAYEEVKVMSVPDVTGGFIDYQARGELVFRKDGKEQRLIATAGETSSAFFVMMWDSTAVTETYQGGRYLSVPFPDESGWTSIDFNRTYNAPCVFTAFSVCGLPPRDNWLDMAVTAGEKRPDKPATLIELRGERAVDR